MKFLLGTKQEMTQIFDETGRVEAGTVLRITPMTVLQNKTAEKDGYVAVQVAVGTRRESRVGKALKGHFAGKGSFAVVKEFRPKEGQEAPSLEVGSTVDLSGFAPGDAVEVSAISKAKGFQGVVKRHGFAGGSRTHGQKHSEREPGSIGATGLNRVMKGMRMGGRMGGTRVTIKGLRVLAVDSEAGTLIISGAVPGRRGTLVEVRGN